MFDRFRKQKPPNYPSETKTSVLQGERNGKPLFVRRNDSAAILAKHPAFKYRAGFAVPLNHPNDHGLPSAGEMQQLNVIEDALVAEMEVGQQSIQVLVITTSGTREFVFYARDSAFVEKMIERFQTTVKSHEIQAYVVEDPGWELYKTFSHSSWPPPA